MRAYAQDELTQLEGRVMGVEEELKVLLLPKDPNNKKNIILEIRAGTGGGEAYFRRPGVFLCIPARGDAALEGRSAFIFRIVSWRAQRGHRNY